MIAERHYLNLSTKFHKSSNPREIVATISTNAVDRDGDVLLPGGLNAREFRKNPVMLFGHESGSLPIGKWTKIEKHGGQKVVAFGELASRPAEHPKSAEWLADSVLHLVKEGVLKGVSVGFLIEEEREPDRKDFAQFGDEARRIVTRWQLVEVSIVPIGCNQDALITAVSKCWSGGRSMLEPMLNLPRRLDLSRRRTYNLRAGQTV